MYNRGTFTVGDQDQDQAGQRHQPQGAHLGQPPGAVDGEQDGGASWNLHQTEQQVAQVEVDPKVRDV